MNCGHADALVTRVASNWKIQVIVMVIIFSYFLLVAFGLLQSMPLFGKEGIGAGELKFPSPEAVCAASAM